MRPRPNLRLAWRRITTGSNHQYKRYFRHLYNAYELALDENLKDLRVRLLSRTWHPHAADRVYLPKRQAGRPRDRRVNHGSQ